MCPCVYTWDKVGQSCPRKPWGVCSLQQQQVSAAEQRASLRSEGRNQLSYPTDSTLAEMMAPLGSIPMPRIAPLGWEGAASFSQMAGGTSPLAAVPASSHGALILFILAGNASHHPTLLMDKYKAKSPGETLGNSCTQEAWGEVLMAVTSVLQVASVLPQAQHQVVPSSSAIPNTTLSACAPPCRWGKCCARCRCHTSPLSILGGLGGFCCSGSLRSSLLSLHVWRSCSAGTPCLGSELCFSMGCILYFSSWWNKRYFVFLSFSL